MGAQDESDINTWLGYLEQVLAPLPATERDDIVIEARAHLEERIAAGLSATSALTGFGKAETYARAFLDDHALTQALDSRRALTMATTLFRVAGQSLIATLGLVGFLVFGATTLGALACILLKLAQPQMVGIWQAPGHFAMGAVSHAPDAPEVAGNWIYPILIGLVIIDAALARLSLVLALKGLKGQTTRD
jgi:uncharacterized membrane protein